MAGFLALGNDQYIGTYKSTGEVENGAFVELDHAAKTGSLAAAGAVDVYFVANELDYIEEEAIDTIDFRVKADKFLRAHKPQAGEILVTTVIAEGLAEGDEVAVGAGGQVVKTPVDGTAQFVVKELTGEYGVPTARLLAL
ncbi:hypothetical protein CIL05_06820 [Virgibacillus profundi]|uniref:DUF2190 domain-containing protein n=1 Tax=Virgibacillus profundi TaxID=2024555 RepID=A0A2A2IG00_9BACI|nr:hypothetical protein [Virgibacillus profundi]PAV30174.1 hypothetical protein CIL05_06820 [Virgibacillus profundi]PXY54346.1 hypothetical protein CIT14_06905 [Virgibacillus profundi]